MELGGEEDDTESGCKRSMSGSDATINSAATKQQALRLAEDLSLPSVQVVVMSANMGCSHCRQRVTKVVSKMNAGLLDYMVDFGKKEVTVRGTVHTKKRNQHKTKHKAADENAVGSGEKRSSSRNKGARTLSWFLGCYSS